MNNETTTVEILQILGTFLTGFVITLVLIPVIIMLSKKYKLMDDPTLDKEQRKMHKDPIPTLGGVGIFIGFIIATGAWMVIYGNLMILSIAISLIILFVTGIFDDLTDLRASLKFLIQIGTAILVASFGLIIDPVNIFFESINLPVFFQYAFSVFLIVGLTNAFNLIDGIDGLAGGLSFMNAVVLGILLLVVRHDMAFAFIAFGFAGALLGFLKYNFNPAKIFMGDTGSLIIGFLMSVLGIVLIKYSDGAATLEPIEIRGLTIIVFGILLLPVYDTLRVFAERMLKKTSPFKPDKTHVHHLLIETGSNHKKAAIILYVANAIIILMAYLLKDINPAIAIPFLFILASVLSESINLKRWTIALAKGKQAEKESEKLSDENRYLTRDSQDFDL
jgi:UDP-N-acetylmuramyl pentapeptide phosphotransferase/UDP-N-acetylglucosamine-1-phosphate transferase